MEISRQFQAPAALCPGNSGVPKSFVRAGGFNKFSWKQRTERTGIWGR